MKRSILPCLMLSVVFTVAGCGDSMDSIAKDMIKWQDDLTAVLSTIKDENDWDNKQDDVKKVLDRMDDLSSRVKSVLKGKKPDEVQKEFESMRDKFGHQGNASEAKLRDAEEALPPKARDKYREWKRAADAKLQEATESVMKE